jgi:hypothetical protein
LTRRRSANETASRSSQVNSRLATLTATDSYAEALKAKGIEWQVSVPGDGGRRNTLAGWTAGYTSV